MHLGTNAVRLRNGLHAAVLHGVSAMAARTYLNFVYVFNPGPSWEIVGVATRPLDPPTGEHALLSIASASDVVESVRS